MRKHKPYYYYNRLLRMNYWFCVGWDGAKFEAFIKSAFDHDFATRGKSGGCLIISRDRTTIVVWTQDAACMPTLAHECCHAADYTLQRIGHVPRNSEPDEVRAYLLAELMIEALSARGKE